MKTNIVGISILVILITLGFFFGGLLTGKYLAPLPTETQHQKPYVLAEGSRVRDMRFVAVDNNGEGVWGDLITEIKPGNGLVLVNINDVLADVNLQYSARLATLVAKNYTQQDLQQTDVIFTIKIDAGFVSGQSAGSTMAASLIAAILDKEVNKSIVMTGSILEDGTVDQAGSIVEKAQAAKKAGATIFLIPKGSGQEINDYGREKTCGRYEQYTVCEIVTTQKKVDVNKEVGIDIIEVQTITEALEYVVEQ